VLWSATAALAAGQAPDAGHYSPERYDITVRSNVTVTMRDGVNISVDLYAPKSTERLPSILSITPYGSDDELFWNESRWYAKRGYVVVMADSRGRNDSEGTWDPFDAKP